MDQETTYTIGQVASMLGINASAIRYYDKQGLLPFVSKNEAGIRVFTAFDVNWLKLIELFKLSGLQLSEMRDMLNLGLQLEDTLEERKALYLRVKERIESKIASLERTRRIVDFNILYCQLAEEHGSLKGARSQPLDSFPEETRELIEQYGLILPTSPFEEALERQQNS